MVFRRRTGGSLVRVIVTAGNQAHCQRQYCDQRGRPARTFPSTFPLLRLDRIYARGFDVSHAEVHHGLPWSRISDHAALSVELDLR